MNETDALARIPEAVAALGISRSKLYLMMATGQLAYTKIGRSRKLPRRELNRLVRENTVARRSAGEDLRGLKDAGRSAPAPAFSASGR